MSEPFQIIFKSSKVGIRYINPFIYYTMSRRARILFYCKLPRIGIYSIRLTPQVMSEPFRVFFWGPNLPNLIRKGFIHSYHIRPIGIRWSSTKWFGMTTLYPFGGWLRPYSVAYLGARRDRDSFCSRRGSFISSQS